GQKVRGAQSFAPSLLRVLPDTIQRAYTVEELHRELEPYLAMKMKRSDNFDAVLAELAPKDKQAAAAKRLGQRSTLIQVVKKHPNDAHATLSMAMVLIELEVLASAS